MESLLQLGLVSLNDEIKFTFKRNVIIGAVGYGGHILNTVILRQDGTKVMTLFTRTYPSLTAWSEACLREGLLEENTRYASWKRVIHTKSQRTLQNLRSQLNVSAKMASASRQDLFSEINRLQMLVSQMKKKTVVPRDSAQTTDRLLMTPSVVEFFNQWATTSLLHGSPQRSSVTAKRHSIASSTGAKHGTVEK